MQPENSTILAIDPSTTRTGWCHAADYGSIPTTFKDRPRRFVAMEDAILSLAFQYSPTLVLYYLPFARGADATRCGWGIAALVEVCATRAGAEVFGVPEVTVRKFHGISTIFGKAHAREDLKDQAIRKARELCFDPENDDEADACLLYAWGREHAPALLNPPKKARKKK